MGVSDQTLRDRCNFPSGTSPEATKHYLEVIDAIEQLYPEALDFLVIVRTKQGTFWDVSEHLAAMGLAELMKAQIHLSFLGIKTGPSKGDF